MAPADGRGNLAMYKPKLWLAQQLRRTTLAQRGGIQRQIQTSKQIQQYLRHAFFARHRQPHR